MPRVNNCSVCGNPFWEAPGDNGICNPCHAKASAKADKERRKETTRSKTIEAHIGLVEEKEKQDRKVKINPILIIKTQKDLEREEETRLFLENKKAGFVYLMRSGNGYYKIGLSKDTRHRLLGLRRQFPVEIEVISQIKCRDCRKVEKLLHKKYEAKRVEYEWFKLDPEDVEWFMSLKNYELG